MPHDPPVTSAPAHDVSLSTKIVRGATIALLGVGLVIGSLWLGVAGLDPARSDDDARQGKARTVRVGGRDATVRTWRSTQPPRAALAALARANLRPQQRPFVQHMPDGRSVLSYRDRAGEIVSVVAMPGPAGGSTLVVTRGGGMPWAGKPHHDADGAEAPDVPRPPDSWRVFCLENPKGSGRFMILYHGYNAADATRHFYLRRMAELGWQFDKTMSRRMSDADADSDVTLAEDFLVFRKAERTCFIGMSDRPSGVVATTLLVR